MDQYHSLYLSRQFILAPQEVDEKFDYNKWLLSNGYILYCHKNLPVTEKQIDNDFIFILGTIFSSLDINATNTSIIDDLFSCSIDQLVKEKIKYYSGRYIILVKKSDDFFILNDASAHRKVYYNSNTEKIYCASQPHILAKILDVKISEDKETSDFYKSDIFLERGLCGILDNTPYDEIKQLTPSKLLNLTTKQVVRFWPSKEILKKPISEVYEESAKLLKNVFKNAVKSNDLMLPLTAGRDSRFLLSASREVSDKIFYYTNQNINAQKDTCDIRIPRKILKKLNLNYYIDRFKDEHPDEFAELIRKNTIFSYDSYNSVFYQVYYKQHPEKLNMPGICGEITYKYANRTLDKYNGKYLAAFFNFKNNSYVEKQYQKWLDETMEICEISRIPVLALFFWEEKVSNWAINVSQMKDVAQDEFYPMNFYALQESLFSAPIKYRDYYSNLLFKGLVKKMCPEISKYPYNPTFKITLHGFLKRIRLVFIVRKIKHIFFKTFFC